MNNKKVKSCSQIKYLSLYVFLITGIIFFTNAQSNDKYLFNDSHFHLTNYIQEGIDLEFYVDSIMGRFNRSFHCIRSSFTAAVVISCNRR